MFASKATKVHVPRWTPSPIWWVFWLFIVVSVLVTGFLTLEQVRTWHVKYNQVLELRAQQEELLSEHTRLQIERGSENSFDRVVEVARQDMGMDFPANVVTVEVGDSE